MKKKITIIAPFYNEESNFDEFTKRLFSAIDLIKQYDFDYIFIDNCSTDKTRNLLYNLAISNKKVKVIFNTKNFGHIRSPYWAFLQTADDISAVFYLTSDLQDPPELINSFIGNWEKNEVDVVVGVKTKSDINPISHFFRTCFYYILDKLSNVEQIPNFTGFGLYNQKFLSLLKTVNDPYPYFRGLVSEFGLKYSSIDYTQNKRKSGFSKNNLLTLYDIGILGLVTNSTTFLRISMLLGFLVSFFSFSIGSIILIDRIFHISDIEIGYTPIMVSVFFSLGFILFMVGTLGEYLLILVRKALNRPVVVEEKRINFD